jgi:hypothetical protein
MAPASHACNEAVSDMMRQGMLKGQYKTAISQNKIANVLQDGIRQQVVAHMPEKQREAYERETKELGPRANEGPEHKLVNESVDKGEKMLLSQAVRSGGMGQIKDADEAVRLLQHPDKATPQDWAKLGIDVGTHGMLPPAVSDQLSKALVTQGDKFFNGRGPGTFSDLQANLQQEMVALKPTMDKVEAGASEGAQTIKKSAFSFGHMIKDKVIDPAKEKINQ